MKRTALSLFFLVVLFSLWFGFSTTARKFTTASLAKLSGLLVPTARAARNVPRTREDFDIRAGLQRTLNDPAEAEISRAEPASGDDSRAQVRRSQLPYALRRAHPSVQMKWSSLTQAPSRVWSFNESLSAPSTDDAEVIARRFLRNNEDLLRLDADDVAALVVARRYQDAHNGLTHLTLQQQLYGLEVFQADLSAHIARNGEVIALSGEALPNLANLVNARVPKLSAAEALRRAAEDAEAELNNQLLLKELPSGAEQKQLFDRAVGFSRDVEARLVYFPLTTNQLRLAWQFILWMQETPDVYLTLIDAEKGAVLLRYNLTNYDENPLRPHGQVFTKDAPLFSVPFTTATPALTPREDLPFRATPFNGSEIFAVSDPHYDWWAGRPANNLISNNTDVHLDRDGMPNQPDLPRLMAADGNFSFPLDLTQAPTQADNQRAAQVNLFYWINRYHDILYAHGFTEAAGNFQTDNFGHGGRGNDAIQGDAQDGAGTNNANFATPPDGSAGRVQMFLWTTANPQRDGDFDQGVVIHELTHGLSNRLVGNATGLRGGFQSGGMGEGWSDYFGLVLLRTEADDPNGVYPVGQYVTNNFTRGIRRFPYSNSLSVFPLTFKDILLSTEVHNVGEIWCNALLEMRAVLIQRYGFKEGQRQAIQLVVDGLKLTPRVPTFVDARNAVLLADRVNNGGANQCLLWQAFSKRGLGFDAETPDANDGAPAESLFGAPYCSTLGSLRLDKPNYIAGETLKLSVGDANAAGTITVNFTTTTTGDRETMILATDRVIRGSFAGQLKVGSGRARPGDGILQGSVEAGDEIVATYNDANTGGGAQQIRLSVPFAREAVALDDSIELGNQGWLAGGSWGITNARGASPMRSWTDSPVGNYVVSTDTSLVSPLLDLSGLTNVTLSFAQSYSMEEGFDYGGIEYSIDDGQTWRRVATTTGIQADFRQAQVRLRALDNQPRARIRFRLVSDVSIVGDGWYVDDIHLTGRSASPAVIAPGTALTPAITGLLPAFGAPAGGTRVTIAGANFTEAEDTLVTFDGLPATGVTLVSSGVLTAVAPAHAAGAVTVRLTNRNGTALLSNGFTYYTAGATARQPEVENLYPNFGSILGGTVVTVLGSNFTPETTVRFDGRAGRVTFVNATTLRVVSPFAPAAGRVDVTVANGALALNRAGAFNYINPTPPAVEVISPTGGNSFFAGSVINIRWRSADNRAVARHRLSLYRVTGGFAQFVSDIAPNVDGQAQTYSWTVPNLALPEARIRVLATDDEGTETENYSVGSFSIARRWESIVPFPLNTLSRQAGAADERFVYAIGGRNAAAPETALTTVQRFDPNATPGVWTPVAPLPTALANGDAVFLRGKIYVPGGTNATNQTVAVHHVYDVATNTWSSAANVPVGSTFYALVADAARGVYYYTGGNSSLTAFRAYDLASNTWSNLPPLATGRTQHEAALIEGKVYVAGGINNTGGLTSAEVFDFETRSWTPIASLNRPRSFFAANVVVRDLAGNPFWLLLGGQDPTTGAVLGPEAYDVRNNRWIVLDNSFNLITPRFVYGQARLGNFFYALGGATPTIVPLCERLRVDQPLTLLPLDPVAPALAVPAAQVAVANHEAQFTVTANDLGSGAPLTLTAAGLPPGASFSTVTATNNSVRGTFRWTPAAGDAGRSFNLTFTASDGQLSDIKIVNLSVVAATPLAAVNAADFRSGALAADSIAALFGSNLAIRTETANEQPLPFELSGTTVTINGVRAPLFFVSPTQINFLVPAALQPGPATIVVSNPAGAYAAGTVQIVPAVPALFTQDQSGRGDALALATVDGVRFQTAPFDVLVNGRPNILVLFGTGLRRALAANPNDDDGVAEAVTATIGGRPARVLFAGAQGGLMGLDQLNLEMPASLAGGAQRRVEVALAINGEHANRVQIEIK